MNLISCYVLNKHGYKLVFKSDRVLISLSGNFIGKDYACGSLFKLCVPLRSSENNDGPSFPSSVHTISDSCDLVIADDAM